MSNAVEQPGTQPTDDAPVTWPATSWLPAYLLVPLAVLLGLYPLGNYDIWWHLRTGELIPTRGVPQVDWYTFGAEGARWIDVHWGFQLLVAAVHGVGGIDGLVILRAVLAGLIVLVALSSYHRTWSPAVLAIVGVPMVLLMSSRFYVRPELLTLLFTACFLSILSHAERRPNLLWLLLPLQVIWANVQGLWIFGPILLGCYVLDALVRRDRMKTGWRRLAIVSGCVLAAPCISPYGIENGLFVLELWQKMRGGNPYQQTIAELKPVWAFIERDAGLYNPYVRSLLVLLGLAAIGAACQWRTILLGRRVFRLLPLLGFGYLGVLALRNGSHTALVVGTVTAWNLGSLALWQERRARWLGPLAAILVCGTLALVAAGWWQSWTGSDRPFGLGLKDGQYSLAAARLAGEDGMPERAVVFHLGHAATYIHENGPERKVMMDGRLEVAPPQLYQAYNQLRKAIVEGRPWGPMLRSLGVDLLIVDVEHNAPVQAALLAAPGWRLIHWGPVVGVFVREEVARELGKPAFDFRSLVFDEQPAKPTWGRTWTRDDVGWRQRLTAWDAADTPIDLRAERLLLLARAVLERQTTQPGEGPNPSQPVLLAAALRAARQRLDARPESAEAARNLADAYSLLLNDRVSTVGPPALALDDQDPPALVLCATTTGLLRKTLETDPGDFTAYLSLANLLLALDASGEAKHFFLVARSFPVSTTSRVEAQPTITASIERLERIEAAFREWSDAHPPTPEGDPLEQAAAAARHRMLKLGLLRAATDTSGDGPAGLPSPGPWHDWAARIGSFDLLADLSSDELDWRALAYRGLRPPSASGSNVPPPTELPVSASPAAHFLAALLAIEFGNEAALGNAIESGLAAAPASEDPTAWQHAFRRLARVLPTGE